MLKASTVKRTCWACPSQWDITLEDGTPIYVRYRYGHFYARNEHIDIIIFEWSSDDILDGYMSDDEMMSMLGGHIDFTNATIRTSPSDWWK